MKQLLIIGDKIQEVDHADIFDLLKSEVRNLFRDLSNFRPTEDYFEKKILMCAWCSEQIGKPSFPDYFLLWTKDSRYYTCFHFRCAFRQESADAVNDLLRDFDYKAPI